MRLAVALLVALSAGCSPAPKPGDASGRLACDHFRNVAGDYADGLLTVSELRDKLREVYDDARLSNVVGLADAGQTMVAELTAGRMGGDFDAAVRKFGDACRSIDR